MKKYTFISLVGLGLLSGWLSSSSLVTHAATFGGGDGSLEKPYLINTPEHLKELRETVNGGEPYYGVYFKQTAPIDFEGYDIDDDPTNGNFAPIGSSSYTFQGNYNGDYHTISNVKITSKLTYTGFFGKVTNNASIKNIAFKNLTIQSSGRYTGGVVGYSDNVSINRVSVEGTLNSSYNVIATTGYVGGIVGYLTSSSSELNSIQFSGEITSIGSNTGGIVGYTSDNSKLKKLLTSGQIKSSGGLVGGIAGNKENTITLQNALVLAKLTGSTKGGVIGTAYSVDNFQNLYWDQTFSETSYGNGYNTGPTYQSGMTGLTTNQLQGEAAKTNLVGFDFENTWETTDGYPRLKWLNNLKSPLTPGTNEVLLSGTVEPTLLNLTVPTEPVKFVINPNLPMEEAFVAPTFDITNDTNLPLTLAICDFEKVDGPFIDVLPTAHDDWTTLEIANRYDLALGVQPEPGVGWKSLTEGIRYVADKTNYTLGVINPNGTVTFSLAANHGFLFDSSVQTVYRLTFIVSFE